MKDHHYDPDSFSESFQVSIFDDDGGGGHLIESSSCWNF